MRIDILKPSKTTANGGFTLVEVALAFALIATVVIAMIGVLTLAVKASHDAAQRTIFGQIIGDVHHRMEGAPIGHERSAEEKLITNDDTVDNVSTGPFLYDEEGIFVDPKLWRLKDGKDFTTAVRTPFYKVDVRLVTPDPEQKLNVHAEEEQQISFGQHAKGLRAAIVEVRWPIEEASLHSARGPRVEGEEQNVNLEVMTYYVNTMTGPGWFEVDEEFEPVIEF